YRNDGGSFTDITYEADVQNYAYGLGVMAADLDLDGRQDLYVSNDFDVPDLMYMAREDGTFSEELQFRTRHISYYSMGCDVADYDNDGLPDIVVLDMTADDHVRSKTNMGSMAPEKFWSLVRGGYYFQYMVNTLQHNNGNGTFSDLGQLAGIARTDWSWAPLLADLDNDGWKDLVVTNGYKYDIRDNDYQQGVYDSLTSGASFFRTLDLIPATRLRNRLFRNNGDLTFSDSTLQWGFTEAMNSNGAAYGDLDGDGDLDLVTNNLDQVATVHENRAEQLGNHHLRVTLVPLPGRSSWGAKVRIRTGDERQYVELSPVRGYQSCVEPVVHFGVGTHQLIDELVVEWPGPEGGSHQVLSGLPVDRTLVLQQGDATPGAAPAPETSGRPLFTELTGGSWPEHVHEEDPYDDFRLEVLLPHKMSELGPLLSVGDMNGDGTDDLFTSGAHGQACRLWLRSTQGGLRASASQPWEAHADQEHLGSCSFDADGDGDLDLLLLAGSNQHDIRDPLFTQRLFLNDGRGGFTEDAEALPPMVTSAMRADAADIDGDGD
ncbi:MAG: CRTAC1 family protein, partial [Flavobacteriales bacterium]|nr:CRTAC1 family protein [Flavobacteriales bacterium]